MADLTTHSFEMEHVPLYGIVRNFVLQWMCENHTAANVPQKLDLDS